MPEAGNQGQAAQQRKWQQLATISLTASSESLDSSVPQFP